ncbi:isoamylase protein [Dictyocaulus viviparus]|uniref:5'-AMP-activated protein kinase subunit beta-1 n=1 Tax=Dictyocaulus viviparus TaxID=29172 RepID=A0A0D8Y0E6_DICVI|nr:isoamylase protein [Dictyocaulus viviparus]
MEQIIGPVGNDPTAPTDLHRAATESSMFDSVTIMGILLLTFCVFYFFDVAFQIFGGVSSAMGIADSSISQAFIEPVPPRTRKRRKSFSRENATPELTSFSQPETTQATSSPLPPASAVPMKDILTKSIRTGMSAQSSSLSSTTMDGDFIRGQCNTSSVELLYYDKLYESHVRPKCNQIYSKNYELPYADDFSGDEFGEYQYEQAQAYLEYMAKLESVRTEYSIDDVSDPDKILDEWEEVENTTSPGVFTTNDMLISSDDDFTDSLYAPALEIYNRIKSKNGRTASNLQNDMIESANIHDNCDKLLNQQHSSDEHNVMEENFEPIPVMSKSKSSTEYHSDKAEYDIEAANEAYKNLNTASTEKTNIEAESDMGNVETPRDLHLGDWKESPNSDKHLLGESDAVLLQNGSRTASSLSVFSVRQSMEIRRYHHVVFTYPDPSPHKVFLTGSFFGWKMSLPMQREGNVFRLSITLPAGEHQYRFEVHRHRTSTYSSDVPYIVHE